MLIQITVYFTGTEVAPLDFIVKGAAQAEYIANQIADDYDMGPCFGTKRRMMDIRKCPRCSATNAQRTCTVELTRIPTV